MSAPDLRFVLRGRHSVVRDLADRTSADDGHTIMRIPALSWADADERGRGRVTTEVAGEAGQLLLGIDAKSKNRVGFQNAAPAAEQR